MKLRVQLQCKNLHEYLRELSPEILDRLYNHPATCLAVYRCDGLEHVSYRCVWRTGGLCYIVCLFVFFLQGAPLSGQELCDANAVPGSASPPGSGGTVGEERQSEVSRSVFVTLLAVLSVVVTLHTH